MQKKIVVLGGGVSALTAAFELTSAPNWQERYAITVYQVGHRLGGKGASGRNQKKHDRIEEHGLHLYYGFYDNAFHVMRRCYEELGRPAGAPLATLEEAWKPHSLVVFEEEHQGQWQHQPLLFPRNAEVLGSREPVPTPAELIPRMLRFLSEIYAQQIAFKERSEAWRSGGLSEEAWNALTSEPHSGLSVMRVAAKVASSLGDVLSALLSRDGEGPRALRREEILKRLTAASTRLRALFAPLLASSPNARNAWAATDLTLAMIRGMIADHLIDRAAVDWMELDGEDFRAWLRRHGASEDAVTASTLCGVYAGAYHAGREMGAGTGLHWTLRMLFTYRGALFYKMQAGMGDTVFAPLYEVLRRRGVRFRFFHRLDNLRLSADRARIEAIEMGRQILTKGDAYEPLIDVKGLPCWPSEPLYEQLTDGEELAASGEDLEDFGTRWRDRGGRLVLRAGEDYDAVLLGIGLGAVPLVCKELINDERNPQFARMTRSVKTTQTASVQLWMKPDLRATGWPLPPPVIIPYAEPLDTWADMSHLLSRESFPAEGGPGSVAYLTAEMADDEPAPQTRAEAEGYVDRQYGRVYGAAEQFLRSSASHLWPAIARANGGRGLDLKELYCPEGGDGEARLRYQHFAPPVNPSDRYVLSVRGSTRDRLGPDESGYENLILCGDWTRNPMNLGCVEGATMAGMAAARVLGAEVMIHDDWLSACAPRAKPREEAPRPLRYIERPLNEATAPPYHATDVSMYTALLEADPERLRGLVDRHLNVGPRVYLPLGPYALFYAQDTRALSASDVPGHVPERDFGFMIPVAVCKPQGGRLVAEGVAVYTPFLWVDLGAAVYGGREVHGFPKGLARLSFPEAPEGDVTMRVQSLLPPRGVPGDRTAPWREETLVETRLVRPAHPWTERALWSASFLRELGAGKGMQWLERSGLDRSARLGLLRELGESLRSGSVRMVFLKQYRDAGDRSRACYQAIVEATAMRRGPARKVARLPGDLLLSVSRESNLVEELGLCPVDSAPPGADAATLRALSAFYMDFDFTLGPGSVVWSSAGG